MRISTMVCALVASTAAVAETPVAPPTAYGAPIAMNDALALVQRGVELSRARGFRMAIAVVEPSGELVAFARMDDAAYGSIQLAQHKARTSARFRMATAVAEERIQSGRVALVTAHDFIAIGGGVPIVENGRVIGAIGVSGATSAEDAAIASAMAARR